MKLLTVLSLATAALAAAGDKYKLTYTKVGASYDDHYPVTYNGQNLVALQEGEAITITEGENNIFSVEGKPISYLDHLAWFWTGTPGEANLAGTPFDVSSDGIIEVRDGPKDYYYCTPSKPSVIYVNNSDEYSKCRFKRHIKLHVQKI